MWTRRNYFIWFEISKENGRLISFPISLVAIRELFESVLELFVLISYLIPGVAIRHGDDKEMMTFKTLRQVLDVVDRMMIILEYEHHLDLVEVQDKDTYVRIALR